MDEQSESPCDPRLLSVRMVITDVDGVLTDGSLIYADDGSERKAFNVRDGAGIKYLLRSGIGVAFLSGRTCRAVGHRAKSLGVDVCVTGAKYKLPAYERILADAGLTDAEVCYIGDDLPDLPLVRRAGFGVAVADAVEEVRAEANYITQTPGGKGAVREVAEAILRAQNKWTQVTQRYYEDSK